jgi:hypothetical protein
MQHPPAGSRGAVAAKNQAPAAWTGSGPGLFPMDEKKKTFACPFCGAEVPAGAAACPECGSDDQTGWSDNLYGLRSEEVKEEKNPLTAKIAIGLAVLLILPFLAALWLTRDGIYLLPVLAAVLAAVVLLERYWSKRKEAGGRDMYQRLLYKAHGDEALVERLVDYEKRKNPFRTRDQMLTDALERWERDSR